MISPSGVIEIPALVDVHVHFREPGYSYKETIHTGTLAARKAGYSDVCTMPNLKPAPDSLGNLQVQLDIIEKDSAIRVHPYASITLGQQGAGKLVDMEALAPHVVGFSDDGRGIQDSNLMREAMIRCHDVDSILVEHCEVNELLHGGYIHDGHYAHEHGHKGICSESEWREVDRNVNLVAQTGCRLHVCHISTRESVEIIRQAKKSGLPVSCETAPHYLILTEDDLREDGCWKMNPPLRSQADKEALLEGLCDGTIECIATDHAPHSMEEKNRGLEHSAFGIVGIETALPLLYTYVVRKGLVDWNTIIDAMTIHPRRIMRLKDYGDTIRVDLDAHYVIDPNHFISLGHSTPFAGWEVFGKVLNS